MQPTKRWLLIKSGNLKPLSGLKAQLEIWAMKRGEVWWINFDPSIGGEIRKQKPAVIVGNDAANHYLNRVQVVPLTSSVDKLYPSEAYVMFRGKEAKAMADQLTTVSKKRLINS